MFDHETFRKYLEAVEAASLVCVRHRDQGANQGILETHGGILRSHVRDAVAYCRGRTPEEVKSISEILRGSRDAMAAWNYYATHPEYAKGTGPVWAAEAIPPPPRSYSLAPNTVPIAGADRVEGGPIPNSVPGSTVGVDGPAPMDVDGPSGVPEDQSGDHAGTDIKMEGVNAPRQRCNVRAPRSKAFIEDSDAEYPNTLLPRPPPEPKVGTYWMKVEDVVPLGSCSSCTKTGGQCIIPYTIRDKSPPDARDTRTRPYARITCHLCYTRHITCVWTNRFQPVTTPGSYIFEPLLNFSAHPATDEKKQLAAALEYEVHNITSRKRKAPSNPPPSVAGTSAPVIVKATRSRGGKPPTTSDAKASVSKTVKPPKTRNTRASTKKKTTPPITTDEPVVPVAGPGDLAPAIDATDSNGDLPKTRKIPYVLLDGMVGNEQGPTYKNTTVVIETPAGSNDKPPPPDQSSLPDAPIDAPPLKKVRVLPAKRSVNSTRETSNERSTTPRVVVTPATVTLQPPASHGSSGRSSRSPIPAADVGLKDGEALEIPYSGKSVTSDELTDLSNRLAELTSQVSVIQASAIRGAKYDTDTSETRLKFKNLEKQTAMLMARMEGFDNPGCDIPAAFEAYNDLKLKRVAEEHDLKMAGMQVEFQGIFDAMEQRLDDLAEGQHDIVSSLEEQHHEAYQQVQELRAENEGLTKWLTRVESQGKRGQDDTRSAIEEHKGAFRVLDKKVTDLTNDIKMKYANISTVQGLMERMDLREDAYRDDRETWRRQTEKWTRQTDSIQTQSEALTAVLLHAIGGSLSGAYGPDTPLGRLIPQILPSASKIGGDSVNPPPRHFSPQPPAPPLVPAPPLPLGPPPRIILPLPRRSSYTQPSRSDQGIAPPVPGHSETIAEEEDAGEPRSSLDSNHRALQMEKAYINMPDEAPDLSSSMSMSPP